MPGYKTWATNDVITASDMNELHADPLTQDVATNESRTSSTYGDLSTVGPAVTKSLVAGQKVLVYISAFIVSASDGKTGRMSFAVSGASTLSAIDANAARYFNVKVGTNAGDLVGQWTLYTATNTGSHTFTAKYKSDDGVTSFDFLDRRIIIKPF